MTLPLKKIYIDTRFKSSDSSSDSDFKIQLTRSVSLPKNTVFYMENFVCSHAFFSVENGINNKFYFKLNSLFYTATIPPSNYNGTTFATALQSAINTTASVAHTVSFSINQNCITITPSGSDHLFVLSDSEIFTSYSISHPNSTNDILNNNSGTYITNVDPYVSGTLNLLCFRNLYLTSANLSSFTTLGARGESNIIKKNTLVYLCFIYILK